MTQENLLTVKKGDSFVIKLDANMGTGYLWEFREPLDTTLLKLVKTGYELADPKKDNGPGYSLFTFRAEKAGETIIKWWYIRPWVKDKAADPHTRYKETPIRII
ncbi:MAG: protease inhibitor I42 family protein [Haliscomenobacter sp.]|nr:protease inhibitor I42 family protein [Haliscomenobacter sp.]MBK8879020.1 protease inhibitor I42 family protein [Haliscomenobacter sp.]